MEEVRRLVSLALEARQTSGIRVRQPLSELRIRPAVALSAEHLALIRDEINVKSVSVDPTLPESVFLNTTLTEELKEEGAVRDLVRAIQELRKEAGMSPMDKAVLVVSANESGKLLFEKYSEQIMRLTLLSKIEHAPLEGEPLQIEERTFVLSVRS